MMDLPIRIELYGASRVRPGERAGISVRIVNDSESDVWFVGALDGSEAGYRYPRYTPEIRGPEAVSLGDGPFWCGTVVPLRAEDFVRLAPGQEFDPTSPENGAGFQPLLHFTHFQPSAPGEYTITLTISTEGATNEDWGVIPVDYPGRAAVLERLARVPRGTATADPLVIRVGDA